MLFSCIIPAAYCKYNIISCINLIYIYTYEYICMYIYICIYIQTHMYVYCSNLQWHIQAGLSQGMSLHSTEICETSISKIHIHKSGLPAPKLQWIIDSCRNRGMQDGAPVRRVAWKSCTQTISYPSILFYLLWLAKECAPSPPTPTWEAEGSTSPGEVWHGSEASVVLTRSGWNTFQTNTHDIGP